jgi:hypothetical protein
MKLISIKKINNKNKGINNICPECGEIYKSVEIHKSHSSYQHYSKKGVYFHTIVNGVNNGTI